MKSIIKILSLVLFSFYLVSPAYGDAALDKLIKKGKFQKAISHANANISKEARTPDVWTKIGKANEGLALYEKALVCYTIALREWSKYEPALIGAARCYNYMNRPHIALKTSQSILLQNYSSEACWEYVRACFLLKQRQKGIAGLQQMLSHDPSDAIANREMGKIKFEEKQFNAAIPLLEIAFKKTKDPFVSFDLGVSHARMEDYKKAIKFLAKAKREKPLRSGAAIELARAYFKTGEYAKTIDEIDKHVSMAEISGKDQYMLAVSYQELGLPEKALREYKGALRSFEDPKNEEALICHKMVGLNDLERNKPKKALKHFNFIYRVDPKAKLVGDIHICLGKAFEKLGQIDKCISILEEGVAINKGNSDAYVFLGRIYEAQNMAEKARSVYENLVVLHPKNATYFKILGNYYLKARQYDKAITVFTKSNNIKQENEAFRGIAISAFALKRTKLARRTATRVLKSDPAQWDANIVLAKINYRDKKWRQAIGYLEFLISKEPENKEFLKSLGLCYDKTGETEKLFKIDKAIVRLDKKNVKSRSRLGAYYLRKNNYVAAAEMYEELVPLSPKDPVVFTNLSTIYEKLKKPNKAIGHQKTLITLMPKDEKAVRRLADLQFVAKKEVDALKTFQMLERMNAKKKDYYLDYADLTMKRGTREEIKKVLSAAVKHNQVSSRIYHTLADLCNEDKGIPKAIKYYQRAIEMDPKNVRAISSLGYCQLANKDVKGAIISLEQATMLNPGTEKENKTLGDLYLKQGKKSLAVPKYKEYLKKNPDNSQIALMVGQYYNQEKDYEQSSKYLAMVRGKERESFEFKLVFGHVNFEVKKYDAAIEQLGPLLEREPKINVLKDILYKLAVSYEKTGSNLKAAKTYLLYTDLERINDPEASYKAAFLQEETNTKMACAIYERNIQKYPDDYRNYYQAGMIYSKTEGMQSEAIPHLKKAIKLSRGKRNEAWLDIAKIHGKAEETEDELKAYQKYLETNPQHVQANKRIGEIYYAKGKMTGAVANLEIANSLSPNDPEILLVLGEAYRKIGGNDEALGLFVKAKALDGSPKVLLALAQLYSEMGRNADAMREVRDLIEKERSSKYLLLYSELLYAGGKFSDAEDAIMDVRTTDPENSEVLMALAKVKMAQNKRNDAISIYKDILDIDRGYVPALCELGEAYLASQNVLRAELFFKRALDHDAGYALAELGLAKVAKQRKDEELYSEHMKRAQRLDPNRRFIVAELPTRAK